MRALIEHVGGEREPAVALAHLPAHGAKARRVAPDEAVLDVVERELVRARDELRIHEKVLAEARAAGGHEHDHGLQHQRVVHVEPERQPFADAEPLGGEIRQPRGRLDERAECCRGAEAAIVESVFSRLVPARAGVGERLLERRVGVARRLKIGRLDRVQDRHFSAF